MGAAQAENRTGIEEDRDTDAEVLTSQLVDSLLHDARNPLNAISIHLEVLVGKLRDEDGEVPPTVQKNLRAIREQVTRLDGMLRQFGAFLAPRREPASPVELGAMVQGACEVLGHVARTRRLTLAMTPESSVLLSAREPSALRRLLLVTLAGAIRATPEGQALSVRVVRDEDRGCVVLEPQDLNGTVLGWEPGEEDPWAAAQALCGPLHAELSPMGAGRELRLPVG